MCRLPQPIIISLALVLTCAPVLADSVGVTVGEAIPFQGAARSIGGTTQLNIGADIALTKAKVLPIRAALMFDYAGGSANGGSLNDYGLGLGARLTTPLYIGAGAFLYNVNANQGAALGSQSTNGFGTNIFVGERILPLPGGGGIGVQITYRQLPMVNGIDPSGLSFALRGSF
jgi:hypothetical protein